MNKFESFVPLMRKAEYVFVEKYLTSEDTFLEWGSGNSTLYFSGIVKHLISIEHDMDYYNFVKNSVKAFEIKNIEQLYLNHDDYVEYPSKNSLYFTKVLVDGRARVKCALSITEMIDDETIVFVHDFNDKQYWNVLEHYDIVDRITTDPGIVALKKKR